MVSRIAPNTRSPSLLAQEPSRPSSRNGSAPTSSETRTQERKTSGKGNTGKAPANEPRKSNPNGKRYISYEGLQRSVARNVPPPKPLTNDEIVERVMSRNRSFDSYVGSVPDASPYVSTLEMPPINETDEGYSMVAKSMTPTPGYAEAEKTLNDKQFELMKEGVKDVDRSFITPDTINHLADLTSEQKAAYLVDLLEAKAAYKAYMDQYGDSVPNGEAPGAELDKRLDIVTKDNGVQIAADEAFSKGAKIFLARPENGALLNTFKDAYFVDITGGKAVERALASGKSVEEAFADYSSERNLLTKVLPAEYRDKYAGAANLTFSELVQEHMVGDGTGGDLSMFDVDANGKSETLGPVADALALEFMAQNLNNKDVSQLSIKLNYAQDITRNVDGVFRLMRTGMKVNDALTTMKDTINRGKTPLGVPSEMYKAGLFHAVQTLSMAGVLTARAIGMGPKPQPADIAAVVASGVQIIGMTTEGLAKNLDASGKPFSMFGTGNGTWGSAISKYIKPANLEAGGKILGGIGGFAMAGLSFFNAHRALNAGEKAEAAFQIINGVAMFGTSAVGLAEVALQFTSIVPRLTAPLSLVIPNFTNIVTNGLKYGLSVAGRAFGTVASLAGVVLGILDMAKGVKKLGKLEGQVNDRLRPLVGMEVQFEFRARQ